jgi:hypothetical protein
MTLETVNRPPAPLPNAAGFAQPLDGMPVTLRNVMPRIPTARVVLLIGAVLASASCTGPTEPAQPTPEPPGQTPEPGPSEPAPVTSLQISAPASLLVHEQVLLTVTARDARGQVVVPSQPPTFSSSDTLVAVVSSSGVVRGLRRGTVTIRASVSDVVADVPLGVKARVRIAQEYFEEWDGSWPLAVGDTLQFIALFVDVDGVPIPETPAAEWTSSNPDAASVSETGLVAGIQALSSARIAAWTVDGSAAADVHVSDVIAGLPASVRFAHAARDVGPVTFLPSEGAPLTLSFGESIERPVLSGTFTVLTNGLPANDCADGYCDRQRFAAMIREGNHLSLYAAGGAENAWLTPAWAGPATVPAGSALVRLVQGWNPFPVVFLRSPGDPASGLPELCYFDPIDVSIYFEREAGGFDIVLQGKYPSDLTPIPETQVVLSGATAPSGGAVTIVLTGSSPETMGFLTFPDP